MSEDLEQVPLTDEQIDHIENLARYKTWTIEFNSNASQYILQLINIIRIMERHNRDMGYERSERD